MSSQSTGTQPSVSKSAAKKRAKRAAATARTQQSPVTATATAEVRVDLGDAVDPNDPNLYHPSVDHYHHPAGGAVDLEYEPFFDDTEFQPGAQLNGHSHSHPHHQQGFPLPFLDYTLSPYNQHPHPFANLPPSVNITNEDLIQTANELYRRMADPKFASDDAYWSSLPAHIRNFIREAVPFAPGETQANGTAGRDESIHSLAQRIVSVASQGMGLPPVGANLLNGSMQSQPRGTQSHPNQAGLARELGFHPHPDVREDEDYDDEDLDHDVEPGMAAPNGDAPKKKNKKKKKKAASVVDPSAVPTSLPPIPPIKQPQHALPPSQQQQHLQHPHQQQPQHHQHHHPHPHPHQQQQQQPSPATRPVLHPPPPPTANAPNTPLPSSRAAGKQPMTANPATNAPARSARQAGKAPASSSPAATSQPHNHPPAKSANAKGKAPANAPPAKIWTQSSIQDRENIRAFWLSLNEAERHDLLQIEKAAVLKKMKEQHRHSCGCAVCGRKKVNIEMELDQLYEQYYAELRSYAADQQAAVVGRQSGPPGAGPFPGSVEVDSTGQITKFDDRAPDRPEEFDDDASEGYEDEEEEYDDEELDDDQSDEADAGDDLDDQQQPVPRQARKPPSVRPPAPRPEGSEDFLTYGSGLKTIKGGILTVADDLLKNDGAKFLEMMEELAVARSSREEQNENDLLADTDDDDLDKEEPITEAERMEEGKRMFQIFAARLFEQRVLQAYREKVAKQREEQLLRELEEEEDSKKAKEEKKAKEAQKKKDKKKLQKQRADEEKAARDAALAEEQRAAKEKAAELERERHKKAEEERARREAVKKAAAEDAARKEAERKKRQQEEREREEEAKRKRLEAQEKARKEKEAREKEAKEKERKEREEKAAKDKAEKERIAKEKAEKDRLVKEKAEKERLAKLEEDNRQKARKEEEAKKERAAAAAAAEQQARQQAEEHTRQQQQQAAQRAAREAKEQQAVFERAAAAERAAASESASAGRLSASSEKNRSTSTHVSRPPSIPLASAPIPLNQPSPIKPPVASSSSSMNRGQSGPFPSTVGSAPKASAQAGFLSQPIPGMPYQSRVPPIGQNLAPGYRQGYPAVSPVYPAPTNGGPSPAPQTARGFPEPSPPFDHIRSAPIGIGMGYPTNKGRPPPIGMDDFSPPHLGSRALSSAGGSSDLPGQLNALSLMNDSSASSTGPSHHSFGLPPTSLPSAPPAPIGPPKTAPMPIGRPAYHDSLHASSAQNHVAQSSSSKTPAAPLKSIGELSGSANHQVLGSAALGSDDDVIVQPARRNTSNGWDLPNAPATAPGGSAVGGSRWSTAAAPSIWNTGSQGPSNVAAPIGHSADNTAPGGSSADRAGPTHWNRGFIPPSNQPRQSSMSGLGGGSGPFGAAPLVGSGHFGQGVSLFSPPPPHLSTGSGQLPTQAQAQAQAHGQHNHHQH